MNKQCRSVSSSFRCELNIGHSCFHKCGGVTWEDGEGLSREVQEVFVLVLRGDQTRVLIVTEDCLKSAVHSAMCSCPALLACETEDVPFIIETLDEEKYWEPGGVEWQHDFGDGSISVFRLSDPRVEDLFLREGPVAVQPAPGENYEQ